MTPLGTWKQPKIECMHACCIFITLILIGLCATCEESESHHSLLRSSLRDIDTATQSGYSSRLPIVQRPCTTDARPTAHVLECAAIITCQPPETMSGPYPTLPCGCTPPGRWQRRQARTPAAPPAQAATPGRAGTPRRNRCAARAGCAPSQSQPRAQTRPQGPCAGAKEKSA